MAEKWFFKQQNELQDELHNLYSWISCNYQDVTKDKVYENYLVWDGKKYMNLHCIIYKDKSSRKRISIFEHKKTWELQDE